MSGPAADLPAFTEVDPSPAEAARLTGIKLAEHPLLAAREGDERPAVEDVLGDARPLLSTYGIAFELLRTRPGFVVLRARSDGRVSAQGCCELVKGLVGALAVDVCDVKATLVESTCAQRGAAACLYSLMWETVAPAPGPAPAPPPSETLLDPPLEPERADWTPPVTPPPPPSAPVEDGRSELPQWDRPVPPAEHPDIVPVDDPALGAPRDGAGPSTVTRGPLPTTSVPTAATTSGFQVHMNTPPVVIPAAAAPVAAPVAPARPGGHREAPAAPGARPRRSLPRGLLRRSWLLALALIAGAAGGWFAGRHAGTSYGAQAALLVQSGAGKTGPGSANDALALATTYSAVIPKDQALLTAVAASLGTTSGAVGSALSTTVQNDTSILDVSYTASTPSEAVQGAREVARVLTADAAITAAIAPGSVTVFDLPTTAHRQGTLHKYGIELGAFLGLIVGLILVLAAERADPRVDDAPMMAAAAGCRASQVPSDVSHAELARVLSDLGRKEGPLTVVPLAVDDTSSTMELAQGLRPCWPPDGPAVAISPSFASGVVDLTRGSGPTVLVTHPGARQRDVVAAADRLRMIGRPPVWAVLAARRLRPRGRGHVG